MSQTIANFNHAFNFSSLDTYNYTILTAGVHRIAVKVTDSLSLSGLSVVIQKNSVTIASSSVNSTPLPTELNLATLNNCAVNDIISVIVTSANASDSAPNVIKGFITLSRN